MHVPAGRPLFSLLESADVQFRPASGTVVVDGRWGRRELDAVGTPLLAVLHRMCLGPVSLGNVAELRSDYLRWRDGEPEPALWLRTKALLDRLGGYIVPSLGSDDGKQPELSLVAVVGDAAFDLPAIPEPVTFATPDGVRLRERPGGHVLVGPGGPYEAELGPPAESVARLLVERPWRVDPLAAATGIRADLVRDVLAYLVAAGLVSTDNPVEVTL